MNQTFLSHWHGLTRVGKVLPAFKDKRYITVDGKPFFMIYTPLATPEIELFIQTWQRLAIENGLPGIHFVGHNNDDYTLDDQVLAVKGIEAVNPTRLLEFKINHRTLFYRAMLGLRRFITSKPTVYPYEKVSRWFLKAEDSRENVYPSVIPDWDHSPRCGGKGFMVKGSTPDLFEAHVAKAVELVENKTDQHKIIIIKSWNEWAEGNYMEPDLKWGHKYLEALYRQVK